MSCCIDCVSGVFLGHSPKQLLWNKGRTSHWCPTPLSSGEKAPDSAAAPRKSVQLGAATKGEHKGRDWSQLTAMGNFSRAWSLSTSLCGQAGPGLGSLRDPRGISREKPFLSVQLSQIVSRPTCVAHFSLHPSPSDFRVSALTSLSGSTRLVQAHPTATSPTPVSLTSTGGLIMPRPYFETKSLITQP